MIPATKTMGTHAQYFRGEAKSLLGEKSPIMGRFF